MSEPTVRGILGDPHETNTVSVPAIPALNKKARTLVTWTYNPDTDAFIVLLFENGNLQSGGSGGWDIKTGLTLPD
jgi:hypothetical protein